jgi:hypothetical protein
MGANLTELIPDAQPFAQGLIDLAGRAGFLPRVTSVLRTHSQQQRLYDSFLRGESYYPVAPPGSSAHEYGFAFDLLAAFGVRTMRFTSSSPVSFHRQRQLRAAPDLNLLWRRQPI